MKEPQNEELERARAQLFSLLKARPRSTFEVRTRLRQKKFSSTIIEEVIAWAEASDYLDDEKFAKLWVEERRITKPKGRQALEQELREKGIERDTIESVLNTTDLNEYDAAYQLATTRLARLERESVDAQRRKLSAFLKRRGFSFSVISKILKEVF
jgi:regulatory protein